MKKLLFQTDLDKHNIDLDEILRLPEYQKHDIAGAENIVVDPIKSILSDWWQFPKELWDIEETQQGKLEEVQFFPEYIGVYAFRVNDSVKSGTNI